MLYFIIVAKTLMGLSINLTKDIEWFQLLEKRKAELNHEDIYCLVKKMFEDICFGSLIHQSRRGTFALVFLATRAGFVGI